MARKRSITRDDAFEIRMALYTGAVELAASMGLDVEAVRDVIDGTAFPGTVLCDHRAAVMFSAAMKRRGTSESASVAVDAYLRAVPEGASRVQIDRALAALDAALNMKRDLEW